MGSRQQSGHPAELPIDAVAAGALGGAMAFAAGVLSGPVVAAAAGGAGLLIAFAGLRSLAGRPAQPLPAFTPVPFDLAEPMPELLLDTPLDIAACAQAVADELLLDEPLSPPEHDTRIVQLFGRGAMREPGELQARIDRHLAPTKAGSEPPDAREALSAALAELRRSLR